LKKSQRLSLSLEKTGLLPDLVVEVHLVAVVVVVVLEVSGGWTPGSAEQTPLMQILPLAHSVPANRGDIFPNNSLFYVKIDIDNI
jgi:hypothetical protein